MRETTTDERVQGWHGYPVAAALAELKATPAGLSQDEAQARLDTYGPNRLPEPPRSSAIRRFLKQFHNILIYVLLGSAVITLTLNHVADSVALRVRAMSPS